MFQPCLTLPDLTEPNFDPYFKPCHFQALISTHLFRRFVVLKIWQCSIRQHTPPEDQIFSFILAFLTRILPARHLKKRNFAHGQKYLPTPASDDHLFLFCCSWRTLPPTSCARLGLSTSTPSWSNGSARRGWELINENSFSQSTRKLFITLYYI